MFVAFSFSFFLIFLVANVFRDGNIVERFARRMNTEKGRLSYGNQVYAYRERDIEI